jgi:predicted nucleic acid-binding protein
VKVLLDTCVLAEVRHPQGNPAVKAAVALISDDELYLSVLVVGEIARAIALLREGRQKKSLTAWLTGLESQFADRVLPVDREIARLWGEIAARTHQAGLVLPTIDGHLAATALRHGLRLMTRNTPHLAATGVLIVDPWAGP